jgi:hypothetical protein
MRERRIDGRVNFVGYLLKGGSVVAFADVKAAIEVERFWQR